MTIVTALHGKTPTTLPQREVKSVIDIDNHTVNVTHDLQKNSLTVALYSNKIDTV